MKGQLRLNEVYELTIHFRGIIWYGSHQKAFFLTKAEKSIRFAATHMQPTFARAIFPCFDEPAMKAKFTLEVKTSPLNQVFSNTDPVDSRPGIVRFQETPLMSVYTMAFAIAPSYRTPLTSYSNRGVRVQVYSA